MSFETDDRPAPFRAFVAKTAEGRNSLPRILIGTFIIVAIWLAGTVVLLAAGAVAWEHGWLPGPPRTGEGNLLGSFFETRTGMAAMILTLGSIWPGVWLVMRLLHRRRLKTLFGADDRLDWRAFRRAAVAAIVAATLLSLVNLATDPSVTRSDLDLGSWTVLLLPLALVLLIQTSAEEILFRGYLLQSLAGRFRSPWIWAVLPALVFAACHWSPGALPWMNGAVLFSIALFAGLAVWLVRRTGNLGTAMGFHFGNNLVALLFVSSSRDGEPLALYLTRPIEDPNWTVADALVACGTQVLLCGLVLFLLLWRKSPLALSTQELPARSERF